MSRIRSSNTKPELALRKELWRRGFRYRLKTKLPGHPDIVFPGRHVVIFVDGCFWHGCSMHCILPKNRAVFWKEKISKNIERDLAVTEVLRTMGWCVIRVWEHEIEDDLQSVTERIETLLHKSSE